LLYVESIVVVPTVVVTSGMIVFESWRNESEVGKVVVIMGVEAVVNVGRIVTDGRVGVKLETSELV